MNHFVDVLNKNGRSRGFLTSNNIAYDAEAFKTAGCFDERFRMAGGEERALNARILQNGGTSILVPDLIVEHHHVMTARGFLRQQRNYGRGSYILHRTLGKELQSQPTSVSLSAYTTLIVSWFRNGIDVGLRKLVLFIAAQAMVVLGFVLEALSVGSRGATSAASPQ